MNNKENAIARQIRIGKENMLQPKQMTADNLVAKLKERLETKPTYAQMSKATGIDQQRLWRIVNGKMKAINITKGDFDKLEEYLNKD
jgi:hypothetical protein